MPFTDSENSQTLRSSRSGTPLSVIVTKTDSTLYPKITNHIIEVIKTLKHLNRDPLDPSEEITIPPLPITGTVKLHGTHADILVYPCNHIKFQSRNIVGLDTTRDNLGFASTMSRKTKAILRLRDLLVARFMSLHPDKPLDPSKPVIIAGEWIGENIQKNIAIAQLSKRFVIISVNINSRWQKDSDYSAISLPNHAIYNISRAGIYNMTLYPDNPQRTTDELTPLAEQVATQCPFAQTFGLTGDGEGIVWKITSDEYHSNPALWFKTKGGRFKPTFAKLPRQSREAGERNREVAAEAAGMWCSEARMEQGMEYLREMGVVADVKGLAVFLKWLQNDILVEEKGVIAEGGVDKASLKIEIAKIAKPWYVRETS